MKRRPRWVVDTNVLVSAFLWQGTPGQVIELAGEKEVQLFTSQALIEELTATLAKKKLHKHVSATGLTVAALLANYRRISTLVTTRRLEERASRDMDDDAVLGCALAAQADYIISGDDDLLSLKVFNSIPIVKVSLAIANLGSKT
jgi:uncharacterized protein